MSSVLVLNASHEPLSVVNVRRALILVFHAKAVTLEACDEVWHSERTDMEVPSVVRLTRYVTVPYQRTVPVTRRAVFGRDGQRCQYCTAPADSIDHVVPRSRGGQHTWENVVACCRRCNVRKGNHLPSEIGLTPLRTPAPPSRYGWILATAGYASNPTWERYLTAQSA